jgi:hypothetical protein
MIKLKQVFAKELGEISLDGIKIQEVQTNNESIAAIRLIDKTGFILDIRPGESYPSALKLSIKAPIETKKVHKVTGTTHNGLVDVSKVFDTKEAADKAVADEIEASESAKLEVVEVEVPAVQGPAINDSDLPF